MFINKMFAYGMNNSVSKGQLKSEIRTKQCTINILHAMLCEQNFTTCNLHNLEELKSLNYHNKTFSITRISKTKYKIEW